jgi:hypothetical protein
MVATLAQRSNLTVLEAWQPRNRKLAKGGANLVGQSPGQVPAELRPWGCDKPNCVTSATQTPLQIRQTTLPP